MERKFTDVDLYHGARKCRHHLIVLLDKVHPRRKCKDENPTYVKCIEKHKNNKNAPIELLESLEKLQQFIDHYEEVHFGMNKIYI